jgi:hypothetical protein
MRLRIFFVLVLVFVLPLLAVSARADTLGSAASFAVLATKAVTDAQTLPATLINGFSAASPTMGALSCTGFVPTTGCTGGNGVVNGTTHLNDAIYLAALADSNKAYLALQNTPTIFNEVGGTCLGVLFGTCNSAINGLTPGVYKFTDSVTYLSGALTLNGGGDPNALWIFQIGTALTTTPDSSVLVNNTGAGAGLYWQVGTQATLGVNSVVQGNFLAGSEVAFALGAQIACGRAFTDTSGGTAVTFDGGSPPAKSQNNLVNVGPCTNGSTSGLNGGVIETGPGGTPFVGAPEPGTFALLSSGLLAMVLLAFRKSRVSSPSLSC